MLDIAAHSKLWGNEKADEFVKQGTGHVIVLSCHFPQSRITHLIDTNDQHLDSNKCNQIKNKMSYKAIFHMITGLN